MSLISRLRTRLTSGAPPQGSQHALSEAERLLRMGGAVAEIRRLAELAAPSDNVGRAWQALFLGDVDQAQHLAYEAADARPYDVDSRIVHGTVRLARNELEHSDHEFEAVIEEFGAEADAADGRRAAILARGFAPLDDIPASDDDWNAAANLLTTLWRLSGLVETRVRALKGAHPQGLAVIQWSLDRGLAVDSEADHGSV